MLIVGGDQGTIVGRVIQKTREMVVNDRIHVEAFVLSHEYKGGEQLY